MAVPIQLWQFTVRDYDRMLASGILNGDDHDRVEKVPRYAAASIAEVWIIDVFGQSIEQYTAPTGDGYRQVETLQHGQTIRSKSLEQLEVAVSDILG